MRIVETSPDRLVLEDRPLFAGGFVVLMATLCLLVVLTGQTDSLGETVQVGCLGVGGVWVAHRFFPFQRLTFDGSSGRFTRIVARVTGRTVTSMPLSSIEMVAVEAQWSDHARMERLVIVSEGEKIPLEFGYHGSPRGKLADSIKDWLEEFGPS